MFELLFAPATRGLSHAVVGALMLSAAPAMAADPVKPPDGKVSSFGKGGSDLPILTRNELRGCLAEQQLLAVMQTDFLKQQADLDAEKAAIEAQRAALKAELETLDRSNGELVDAFNLKATAQDERIEAYNQRGAPFNARASEFQAQRAAWDKACGNRRYQENDLIVIKAGR